MPQETELGEGELEALMRQYQSGDAQATASLILRVSPRLFQFFRAQTGSRIEAEDLLQDFWLRVHKARRTYRPTERLLPWMYAIARRVQIDSYRRRSRIARHELVTDRLPEAPVLADSAGESRNIADLLKELPEQQRETLLLLKVQGLSLDEVARVKGTSVGAIKQRAHRAFQALRKALRTAV